MEENKYKTTESSQIVFDTPKTLVFENCNLNGILTPAGDFISSEYPPDYFGYKCRLLIMSTQNKWRTDYMASTPEFYKTKPLDMLQEEYFLMKYDNVAKLTNSSKNDGCTEVTFFTPLTYHQIAFIKNQQEKNKK